MMPMKFSSTSVKHQLTEPIIAKWINAFEEIIGFKGHFYPVKDEPISFKDLVHYCNLVRKKIGLERLRELNESPSPIIRKEAFSLLIKVFPELKEMGSVPVPFNDLKNTDSSYDDVTILKTLDIIGTVYRSRDVDPNRSLTYFEAAKILTRTYHVITKTTINCQVFLAHSSKDKDIVRSVRAALEARGITCFIDEVDLHLSDDLQEALANKIAHKNTIVVAFLSKHSIDTPWVKFELRVASHQALSNSKKLLLLRLDEIEMPAKFLGLRYSDFLYCRSKKEYEALCDLEKNVEEIYFTLLASRDAHSSSQSII